MDYDDYAHEIDEHEERIEQLEQVIAELLEAVCKLREELTQRKRRVQEMLFQAVPNSDGEMISFADSRG